MIFANIEKVFQVGVLGLEEFIHDILSFVNEAHEVKISRSRRGSKPICASEIESGIYIVWIESRAFRLMSMMPMKMINLRREKRNPVCSGPEGNKWRRRWHNIYVPPALYGSTVGSFLTSRKISDLSVTNWKMTVLLDENCPELEGKLKRNTKSVELYFRDSNIVRERLEIKTGAQSKAENQNPKRLGPPLLYNQARYGNPSNLFSGIDQVLSAPRRDFRLNSAQIL